jgi:hypothetical protein
MSSPLTPANSINLKYEAQYLNMRVVYHKDAMVGLGLVEHPISKQLINPFDILPWEGYIKIEDEEMYYQFDKLVMQETDADSYHPAIYDYASAPTALTKDLPFVPTAYVRVLRWDIPTVSTTAAVNYNDTVVFVNSTDRLPKSFVGLLGSEVARFDIIDRERLRMVYPNYDAGDSVPLPDWTSYVALDPTLYTAVHTTLPDGTPVFRRTWAAGTPLFVLSYGPGFSPFTNPSPLTTPVLNNSNAFFSRALGIADKFSRRLYAYVPQVYWDFDSSQTLKKYMDSIAPFFRYLEEDLDLQADMDYAKAKAAWLPYMLRNLGWETKTDNPDFWRWQVRYAFTLFKRKGIVRDLRSLLKLLYFSFEYYEKWRNENGDLIDYAPEYIDYNALTNSDWQYYQTSDKGTHGKAFSNGAFRLSSAENPSWPNSPIFNPSPEIWNGPWNVIQDLSKTWEDHILPGIDVAELAQIDTSSLGSSIPVFTNSTEKIPVNVTSSSSVFYYQDGAGNKARVLDVIGNRISSAPDYAYRNSLILDTYYSALNDPNSPSVKLATAIWYPISGHGITVTRVGNSDTITVQIPSDLLYPSENWPATGMFPLATTSINSDSNEFAFSDKHLTAVEFSAGVASFYFEDAVKAASLTSTTLVSGRVWLSLTGLTSSRVLYPLNQTSLNLPSNGCRGYKFQTYDWNTTPNTPYLIDIIGNGVGAFYVRDNEASLSTQRPGTLYEPWNSYRMVVISLPTSETPYIIYEEGMEPTRGWRGYKGGTTRTPQMPGQVFCGLSVGTPAITTNSDTSGHTTQVRITVPVSVRRDGTSKRVRMSLFGNDRKGNLEAKAETVSEEIVTVLKSSGTSWAGTYTQYGGISPITTPDVTMDMVIPVPLPSGKILASGTYTLTISVEPYDSTGTEQPKTAVLPVQLQIL